MEKGFIALALPSVDGGIGGLAFWVVMIIAVPAVLLIGILYLVGRMSSSIDKEPESSERRRGAENSYGDDDVGA